MALSCYASHDLKEIASRSLLFQTSPSHRDTILMRGRPMLQWFPRSTRSHVLKTRLMHIQCTQARSLFHLPQRAQLTRSASGATCGAGATPGAAASSWLVMAASSEYLLNLWTSAFSEATTTPDVCVEDVQEACLRAGSLLAPSQIGVES